MHSMNLEEDLESDEPLRSQEITKSKQIRAIFGLDFWYRRIPLLKFLQDYDVSGLLSDVIAGLTVALTVIPQSMAIAVVAGLPPQFGLYSAFLNGFIYAVLGSSKAMSVGPTVVTAMLSRPFVDRFGFSAAITVALYSGFLVCLLGIFNLGFLVDFISWPVLAGFMSAAGLSVMSGQVPALLGISGGGSNFLQYWIHIGTNIQDTNLADAVLGVSCIAALAIFQIFLKNVKRLLHPAKYLARFLSYLSRFEATSTKARERVPVWKIVIKYIVLGRNAIVVIIGSVIAVILMDEDGKTPFKIAGDIPEGLPAFQLPPLMFSESNQTMGVLETLTNLLPATVVSLDIIMESMMSAKAFRQSVDATQEMLAVGVCNVLGSFFQSFAVAGSITRTAINFTSGVRTTLSGVVTGSLVLLSLVFLTSALRYLPSSTLAAVVFCAVYFLVQIRRDASYLWKINRVELWPYFATLLGCLFIGTDVGMVLGLATNALFILYHAASPCIKFSSLRVETREVLIARPDRCVTYPGAERIKLALTNHLQCKQPGLLIVIDGTNIALIDSTAVKVFKSLLKDLEIQGHEIAFKNWSLESRVMCVKAEHDLERIFLNGDKIVVE